MGLIYKITNKVNGKSYIGQTVQTLNKRKSEHYNRFQRGERDHKLYQAMRKYGFDSFEFSILEDNIDSNDLTNREDHYMNYYDTLENGYNMVSSFYLSDESRDKISKALEGRKIHWYDKILQSRRENGSYGVYYKIQRPDGEVDIGKDITSYCKENNLDISNLYKTEKGRTKCCKGYVLLGRFNDYPEREYSQAAGNGAHPTG